MAKIIGLPKLSPTMDEGTLVRWVKAEGESVDIDDLLAEVETDKATMEFRSFDKGVLLKQLAPEGSTLAPDAPVAIIGQQGEDIQELLTKVSSGSAPSSSGGSASAATAVARPSAPPPQPSAAPTTSVVPPSIPTPVPAPIPSASRPQTRAASQDRGQRGLASPLVRRLARERGIDVSAITGTGPRGRVIKRDLDANTGAAPSLMQFPALEQKQVPLTSMRKTIARRLSESKQQVPHFYLTIDIDADALWQARIDINKELEARGEKVSINDMIIKASALALRKVPSANASFMGDSIVYHGRVDISVAVAVADGLVTPVVRQADTKNVAQISKEVKDMATRAKQKKLGLEEMQNGTFSISNLGMFGIEHFAAVINPPEGAILAVGTVRQEPAVKHDAIVSSRRLRMTLSCDHRVIDGAIGAQWLAALREFLEHPVRMFL